MRYDFLISIIALLYVGQIYSYDVAIIGVGAIWVLQSLLLLAHLFRLILLTGPKSAELSDEDSEEIDNSLNKIIYNFKVSNSKPFPIIFLGYVLNITLFAMLLSSGFPTTALFHAVVFFVGLVLVQSHGKLEQEE